MTRAVALCVATLAVVAVTWWWLGRPAEVPPVAADPGRIQCVSYAPFRSNDSPLEEATRVSAGDIEEDLTKLARLTDCVRTYSNENGLDQVPAIARRLGLKVIQGLWLGSDRKKNRARIDATVALAKQYRDTITAIVVGNEVLLRGELAASDIAEVLHEVKAATGVPVTYADVWEYWLRNRELAEAVDFITIHILPYWEDFPISAEQAGAHVDAIRSRVAASFPGKDILIGEVGWPSAGRMREGALPSPANQARVLEEVMARARANHYRVNLIEAFDQPWKRTLEGTVGGYWGLLTSGGREPKFVWGQPVSNHPLWVWQGAAGVALAAIVFAAAFAPWRGEAWSARGARAAPCRPRHRRSRRRDRGTLGGGQCDDGKPRRRRMGARPRFHRRLRRRARRRRHDAVAGRRGPILCPRSRPGGTAAGKRRSRWRPERSSSPSPCSPCRPRSASCSTRATAISPSRRSPRRWCLLRSRRCSGCGAARRSAGPSASPR